MKKSKLLVIGGSAISALVVAMLVVPSFIDWSKYQDIAKQKVAEASGYELSIGGALRIGLLPSPHASVENVTLKKPSAAEPFLKLDSANVHLALLPLLGGHIAVSSVTLEKPVVNLVTAKDGTDNWKPKTTEKPVVVDAVTGEPVKEEGSAPAVSVNALNIHNGTVTVADEGSKTSHTLSIKKLGIKADTLAGPFEADGTVGYGDATFNVDVTTSGYRAGESLRVQLGLDDDAGRAQLKWSGIVATGDKPELQGELDFGFSDISGVLADAGLAASVPFGTVKTKLTGMLTASADALALTNGAVELGDTRLASKFSVTGLSGGAKTVTALVESSGNVDLDSVVKNAQKMAAKSAKAEEKSKDGSKPKADYNFIPANFELPADMNIDVQLRGKGLDYKLKKTGPFDFQVKAAGGKGEFKGNVSTLPGGGMADIQAALVSKGVVEGMARLTVESLKLVLSDWLELVDESAFHNPSMPKRIETSTGFRVAGRTASANIQSLSLGATTLNGSVAYTAGARPLLDTKINANMYTLPAPEGAVAASAEKAGSKSETGKKGLEIDPPQLPFDVKFDVSVGRLVRGDMAFGDVKAAGSYNGKSISLANASANVNGGTVRLGGTVADLKALSGVDVKAGLATSDLEGFYKGVTGKPLELSRKIGAFDGSLTAKGDQSKLDVAASLKALGYTVDASGGLAEPLAGDLPSALNVRVRHANFVEAVRAFSPGFSEAGSSLAKPIDISGQIKVSGKSYAVENLKGVLGSSDIAGSLKADMGGKVPAISADITSTRLDVGALVGVESKQASKSASPASGVVASQNMSPWSREPLDTAFLQALDLDIKFNAGTLLYGTWALQNAKAEVEMRNGTLKASPISGKLYDGAFDASLNATSAGAKAPLAITLDADIKNVAMGPFLSALMSSSKKMADGTASLDISMKGEGTSSASLVSSLAGEAKVKAEKPVVYGIDIDQFAADTVEAFDGGWKGVIAGFANKSLSGGKTEFKDISHTFAVNGGEMPIKAFTLETTKGNATVVSNGSVSFARWNMDIQSDVKVTQPKDVPVIGVRISGPLSSPGKNINSQALDNLLRSKVGDKVNKLVGDKIKGTAAEGLVNQFLPGVLGTSQTQGAATATQPAATTPDAVTPEATTPEATTPEAATQAAPAAEAPAKAPTATPEEQLINGLINQLAR